MGHHREKRKRWGRRGRSQWLCFPAFIPSGQDPLLHVTPPAGKVPESMVVQGPVKIFNFF